MRKRTARQRFTQFCAALVLLGVGIGWALALHLWFTAAGGVVIGAVVLSNLKRRLS